MAFDDTRGPGRREPSDDCGSSRGGTGGPPAAPRSPAAVAAVTPNGGSNGGSTTERRQIVRAGRRGCVRALQKAVDDANERGAGPRPSIDPRVRRLPVSQPANGTNGTASGSTGSSNLGSSSSSSRRARRTDLRRWSARRFTGRRLRSAAVSMAARATWQCSCTHGQWAKRPHFFGGGDAPGMMGPNDARPAAGRGQVRGREEEERVYYDRSFGVLPTGRA